MIVGFTAGFWRSARALLGLASLVWVAWAAEPAKPSPTATEREIAALLAAQSAAWNRGDIPGFMQGYVQTDQLRFASGDTVTYGWRATLARYEQRYPDRRTMGTLTFTDLVITPLAPDAALVFGRWHLVREQDAPHGLSRSR